MDQKEIICRLLTSLRETVQYQKRLHHHLAKLDVDMDLFKDTPLENAACHIVTTVIDDSHLVYWWIFNDSSFYTYTPKDGGDYVRLETAEQVWDYYFKKQGAAEKAQN